MSDTETVICCIIVSNPAGGTRPRGWQKRVNDHIRSLAKMAALQPDAAVLQEEAEIDALRLKAFWTNAAADRDAYFAAVSVWFQNRHGRALPAVQPDDDLVGHMTKLIAGGLDRIEALTAERDRLRGALLDHNDLLRSAIAIAEREGVRGEIASTNWDAYYNRAAVVLKRHHQITTDARAALKGESHE